LNGRLASALPLQSSKRYATLAVCALALVAAVAWWVWLGKGLWAVLLFAALVALGIRDLTQRRHAILRNYPVIGHLRFLFEYVGPEIRQYFIESDTDAAPFSRAQRSLVYQRAKGQPDNRPFGTQLDVGQRGYEWVNHSMMPTHLASSDFRITIGPQRAQPYEASIFNISAMSFGSLSANAILALNRGAKLGHFAHDTGEGSISSHHRVHGGDLIWEIGSGYFGCRDDDGRFCPERFAANAREPQVKMIEIKLSQGAKPGHGGILPAAKVTPEIAAARGVRLVQRGTRLHDGAGLHPGPDLPHRQLPNWRDHAGPGAGARAGGAGQGAAGVQFPPQHLDRAEGHGAGGRPDASAGHHRPPHRAPHHRHRSAAAVQPDHAGGAGLAAVGRPGTAAQRVQAVLAAGAGRAFRAFVSIVIPARE
jgi:hypothetical protein